MSGVSFPRPQSSVFISWYSSIPLPKLYHSHATFAIGRWYSVTQKGQSPDTARYGTVSNAAREAYEMPTMLGPVCAPNTSDMGPTGSQVQSNR